MPQVSVIILTKDRKEFLSRALKSVEKQTFRDFEIVVVDDGSTDGTMEELSRHSTGSAFGGKDLKIEGLKIIRHETPLGIIQGRIDGLNACQGEYVAILDDDDEWADADKLKKQVSYFETHPDAVLAGGFRQNVDASGNLGEVVERPVSDEAIRKRMLLKNPFFTSAVMFRKSAAVRAGGFIQDSINVAEDYDLWLRMGTLGTMYNFPEVFVKYHLSSYNKEKFQQFLGKQLMLIKRHKRDYPNYLLSFIILKIRLLV